MSVNSVNNQTKEVKPLEPEKKSKKGNTHRVSEEFSQTLITNLAKKGISATNRMEPRQLRSETKKEKQKKELQGRHIKPEVFNRGTLEQEFVIFNVHSDITEKNAVVVIQNIFSTKKDEKEIAEEILKFFNDKKNFKNLVEGLFGYYENVKSQSNKKQFFYKVIAYLVGFENKEDLCKKLVSDLAYKVSNLGQEGDSQALAKEIYEKYKGKDTLYSVILGLTKVDVANEKPDATLLRQFSLSNTLTKLYTQELMEQAGIPSLIAEALNHPNKYDLKQEKGVENFRVLIRNITNKCFALQPSAKTEIKSSYKEFIQEREDIIRAHFKGTNLSKDFMVNNDVFFYGINPIIGLAKCPENAKDLRKNLIAFGHKMSSSQLFEENDPLFKLNPCLEDMGEVYCLRFYFTDRDNA